MRPRPTSRYATGARSRRFAADDLPDPDTITVAGESGAGSSDPPEALRLTADPFAGNRPDGPSLGHAWFWEPALRTPSDAATAGAARQRMLRAAQKGGRLRAFLQPKLRPGVVIESARICRTSCRRGRIGSTASAHRRTSAVRSPPARAQQGGDSFDPSSLLGSARRRALAGAL